MHVGFKCECNAEEHIWKISLSVNKTNIFQGTDFKLRSNVMHKLKFMWLKLGTGTKTITEVIYVFLTCSFFLGHPVIIIIIIMNSIYKAQALTNSNSLRIPLALTLSLNTQSYTHTFKSGSTKISYASQTQLGSLDRNYKVKRRKGLVVRKGVLKKIGFEIGFKLGKSSCVPQTIGEWIPDRWSCVAERPLTSWLQIAPWHLEQLFSWGTKRAWRLVSAEASWEIRWEWTIKVTVCQNS